jgi:hypothetical protein
MARRSERREIGEPLDLGSPVDGSQASIPGTTHLASARR